MIEKSEEGIKRKSIFFLLFFSTFSVFISKDFFIGFLEGSLASILGFYLLGYILRKRIIYGKKIFSFFFWLRFFALFLFIYFVIKNHLGSPLGLILGLSTIVISIHIECISQIFKGVLLGRGDNSF